MFIRRATWEDVKLLGVLFDSYRVFYNKKTDPGGAKDFVAARLRQNESVIYVASTDEQLLTGFVQLYPLFSSTQMKRLWLLNDLFVQPEYRGQGISVALIDAAKDLCRETGSCGMMLETAKDNVVGNELYRRTGFSLDVDHNYFEWEAKSE